MFKTDRLLKDRKHYLLLLVITLLAYWPLTFSVFSLKNDSLIYFLPFRYHVSEAIQHGSFPWWNPYLYTGLPLHSDIQSGVWNPVVMLISCFTTYNMTVLQWELLFYLFIAAVGMYKLVKEFGHQSSTALLAAIAYLCCGFMTDSGSFIPWIANAAYLPFVFCYFYRLLNKPALNSSLKFSLALILLLTTGYPSYFIFSVYIMTAGFIAFAVKHRFRKDKTLPVLRYSSIALVAFALVCSPVILSWWDFFSYYDRGSGATLDRVLLDSFPPFSSLSYILPSAVAKDHPWLGTDISMRNASVGIFIFLFFLLALSGKLNQHQKFILAILLFSFIFSLGSATPFREWCYDYLPFMNTFRHPACMRVFSSIAIILLAAPVLESFQLNAEAAKRKMLRFITVTAFVMLGLAAFFATKSDLIKNVSFQLSKEWFDRLSFADVAVVQALLQFFFLSAFLLLIWKNKTKFFPLLLTCNSILFCWMALPFTFISRVKTSAMNNRINSFPKGFPLPDLSVPVDEANSADSAFFSVSGYDNFYNKKIVLQDYIISPTVNTRYHEFLLDKKLRERLKGYPFAYFSDSSVYSTAALPDSGRIVLFDSLGRPQQVFQHTTGSIKIKSFSNNKMEFETSTESYGLLNLFQQYHHGWRARADDEEIPIYRTNRAFMSVPVPAGKHIISLRFKPVDLVHITLYISVFSLLLLLALLSIPFIKNNRSS